MRFERRRLEEEEEAEEEEEEEKEEEDRHAPGGGEIGAASEVIAFEKRDQRGERTARQRCRSLGRRSLSESRKLRLNPLRRTS